MCCLFGLMDCRGILTARQRTRILEPLAVACELRGTDATGTPVASSTSARNPCPPISSACASQRRPGW